MKIRFAFHLSVSKQHLLSLSAPLSLLCAAPVTVGISVRPFPMATAVAPVSVSGGNHIKTCGILPVNSGALVKTRVFTIRGKARPRNNRNLSVHAQYNDRSSGSGADFVAGFVLGGAVFGTLAYIFAPQIRRSLLNEDEYGFRRAKKPIYYDEGLEKTRQTLNEKIGQLNSAIDNVSSRLRGGNNLPQVPLETDAEEAAL